MNTYEKCKAIQAGILRMAAEPMCYDKWSPEFVKSQILEIPSRLESIGFVDPNNLTENEMQNLGFGVWSKDDPIRLIPLWLYPFLAARFKAKCIDGEEREFSKSEIDNDNRFGFLAYGVVPKSA